MKNIETIGKECVGCRNCEIICPVKAINVVENEDGFLYPIVKNESCIKCGKCTRKCPQLHEVKKQINHESYIAITKDKTLYKKAASGGIVSSIVSVFLQQDNAEVYASAYDNGSVKHICITNVDEISKIAGSKYVQSDLCTNIQEIEKKIQRGKKILFIGTPCQVEALYAYIGRDSKLIYTIDIVCHGVPNNRLLCKDLKFYNKDGIDKVVFRKKHKYYKSKSNYILQLYKDNKLIKKIPFNRDPYYKAFMEGLSYRESCYNCHYACSSRVGDITVGDCDSFAKYPSFHIYEATSIMLVNSEKGRLLHNICDNIVSVANLDLEEEEKKNHQLKHSVMLDEKKRREFLDDSKMLPDDQFREKWAKPFTFKNGLYQILLILIPERILFRFLK